MITRNNNTTGLGILRVITCLLIIKNICFYLPMANELFGKDGIFPYPIYLNILHLYKFDFLSYPFYLPLATQFFLFCTILLAVFYLLGFGGKLTGLGLIAALFILRIRNGFILDGSDNVIQVILPFLVLADDNSVFRYSPKKIKEKSNTGYFNYLTHKISEVALVGLMVQVAIIYFFTAFAKLQGNLWLNGTAIYYTMRVKDFMATSWNIPLTKNHYFVVVSTYFTIFWELSFPFLIWFKKTKYWIMALGVFLHLGIWLFMRIDNFSWIMIGTYFIFITDEEYQYFIKKLRLIKYDINCVRFFLERISFKKIFNPIK